MPRDKQRPLTIGDVQDAGKSPRPPATQVAAHPTLPHWPGLVPGLLLSPQWVWTRPSVALEGRLLVHPLLSEERRETLIHQPRG